MAQIRTPGTVTVTPGSNIITGTGTGWAALALAGTLKPGHFFHLPDDPNRVPWTIADISTTSEQITLTANFAGGLTGSGLNYVITYGWSPFDDLYMPDPGDVDIVMLIKHGIVQKLDGALGIKTLATPTADGLMSKVDKNKVARVYDFKADFNAKGDGVTDDSPAWSNAMTTMQDGDTLHVPKGRYRYASQIIIPKYLHIIGDGFRADDYNANTVYRATIADYTDNDGTIFYCDFTTAIAKSLLKVTGNGTSIEGIEFFGNQNNPISFLPIAASISATSTGFSAVAGTFSSVQIGDGLSATGFIASSINKQYLVATVASDGSSITTQIMPPAVESAGSRVLTFWRPRADMPWAIEATMKNKVTANDAQDARDILLENIMVRNFTKGIDCNGSSAIKMNKIYGQPLGTFCRMQYIYHDAQHSGWDLQAKWSNAPAARAYMYGNANALQVGRVDGVISSNCFYGIGLNKVFLYIYTDAVTDPEFPAYSGYAVSAYSGSASFMSFTNLQWDNSVWGFYLDSGNYTGWTTVVNNGLGPVALSWGAGAVCSDRGAKIYASPTTQNYTFQLTRATETSGPMYELFNINGAGNYLNVSDHVVANWDNSASGSGLVSVSTGNEVHFSNVRFDATGKTVKTGSGVLSGIASGTVVGAIQYRNSDGTALAADDNILIGNFGASKYIGIQQTNGSAELVASTNSTNGANQFANTQINTYDGSGLGGASSIFLQTFAYNYGSTIIGIGSDKSMATVLAGSRNSAGTVIAIPAINISSTEAWTPANNGTRIDFNTGYTGSNSSYRTAASILPTGVLQLPVSGGGIKFPDNTIQTTAASGGALPVVIISSTNATLAVNTSYLATGGLFYYLPTGNVGDRINISNNSSAAIPIKGHAGSTFYINGQTLYANSGDTYSIAPNESVMLTLKDPLEWVCDAKDKYVNPSGSSQWITSGSDIYYSAGKIGVGTATPQASIDMTVGTASVRIASPGGYPGISFYHAGTSIATPTASPSGSPAMLLQPYYHDGTSFLNRGYISFTTTGAPATGNIPTDFVVGTGATTATERLRITSAGNLRLSNQPAPPATAASPGTVGDIIIDGIFIYYCYATNSWRRSALNDW